ncbi:hypothetical protein [Clostridium sp.]
MRKYKNYKSKGLYGTYWTGYDTEIEYNEENQILKIVSNGLVINIIVYQ